MTDPPTRSVIAGTAGHIDHGKTALVYALTGTDTDRLPEEKRRGITIDLGFAAMRLPGAPGEVTQLSFIDVPGHHAFVRNMLAGTGGIECVLLIVAADEGVRAQTREHLEICSLLGIERGLIVLTKRDAVDALRLEEVRQQAAALAHGTFLDSAPMLAVSAKTGEGMAELRGALLSLVASLPARPQNCVPRLPPDRAFSMRGFGTVVTGTLQSGTLRTGAHLLLEPGERSVRVRGLQVHGAQVESVSGPSRVALNLVGIEPADVRRGQTLTIPSTISPVQTVDAELSLLSGASPLKHRARVRFHAWTADIAATVLIRKSPESQQDAPWLVRLQLERPQVLLPGDRFVLRQPSPAKTIGGGRILDIAGRRGTRKADALRWLQQLRTADPGQQMLLRIERFGTVGARIGDLVRETGLCAEAIHPLLTALDRQGSIVVSPGDADFVISARSLGEAEEAMLAQVSKAQHGSMSRAALQSRTGLSAVVFELALHRAAAAGRIAGSEVLSLPGRTDPADDRAQRHTMAMDREYAAAGIAPPLLRELAERLRMTAPETREAVTRLLRSKRLVRLGSDDLYIHCDALAQLNARLLARRGESFDVARFKSFTGLTRKHAIPLLEYLDRAHITRNSAGVRTVV